MGVQFGRLTFDGRQAPSAYLDQVKALLSPYGPEGNWHYRGSGVDLLWFSFETLEKQSERQPMELTSGEVLLWNGRLDNGTELLSQLRSPSTEQFSDIDIVVMSWLRWKEQCLPKLVGDWTLTVWNPRDLSLALAADFLAARHLFYRIEEECVEWSTLPEPLLELPQQSLSLNMEYLAGWLSHFPAAHLTPYRELHRVPPASIVTIRDGRPSIRRYWDFEGRKRIIYPRDRDYEEHFFELLCQSVRRRLRSASPVLAELSGGMDSSSIVCIADDLTSACGLPQIDTVSFYDDREPHWNERPWFVKVEAQRRKIGLHVDLSLLSPLEEAPLNGSTPFNPGAANASNVNPLVDHMIRNGHRVLLSGIGGDEFLGGVPTPIPELEDLVVRGHLITLARSLGAWSLVQRRPWVHLFRDAMAGFLPCAVLKAHRSKHVPSWLSPEFARRHWRALAGYPKRSHLLGPLPTFQENVDALETIRRQLGCSLLRRGYPYDKRYPFLDRDLLEFLFAIPRQQLVRPGERRSLMRRALRGIVPAEILNRKRKAYVSASPARAAAMHLERLLPSSCPMMSEAARIVVSSAFLEALDAARRGRLVPSIPLLRTVALEVWLKALAGSDVLSVRSAAVAIDNVSSASVKAQKMLAH
jgi:asparagine synthase (glutamine-hydrolysing)